MFSIKISNYKIEILAYLASGGIVSELPVQDNPTRISAQTRLHQEEEDEDKSIIAYVISDVHSYYIGRREK